MQNDEIRKHVHYGKDRIPFTLPNSKNIEELHINGSTPKTSEHSLVVHALDNPIGSRTIERMAEGSKRILIVSDDNTRPTPVHKILPEIIDRLQGSGIQPGDISILIASGTHRPMTEKEMVLKLGKEIVNNYRVENHTYQDENALVELGTTSSGVPILINRLAVEADMIIGIGNIVPHRFCGWSGGAKIVIPGICGEKTTERTHLMVTSNPDIKMGVTENSAREEMEKVVSALKNLFIVNTILNDAQQIIDVVAGDVNMAFRAGVEKARDVYSSSFGDYADIVIASAYPNDFNLWQAGKALYSAELAVKAGGIIIFVSPFHEGIGEHVEFAQLLGEDHKSILQMIQSGKVKDRIGASAALAVSLVREHAEIWLVSGGISSDQAKMMNFRSFESIQLAVDTAISRFGKQSKITIIHDATEVLPTCKNLFREPIQ